MQAHTRTRTHTRTHAHTHTHTCMHIKHKHKHTRKNRVSSFMPPHVITCSDGVNHYPPGEPIHKGKHTHKRTRTRIPTYMRAYKLVSSVPMVFMNTECTHTHTHKHTNTRIHATCMVTVTACVDTKAKGGQVGFECGVLFRFPQITRAFV